MLCKKCGSDLAEHFNINGYDKQWCRFCADEWANQANIEDDKTESIVSFNMLKIACKGFKAMYEQYMYNSDNDMVMDKMHTLEALLDEFETTCEDALRGIGAYYD